MSVLFINEAVKCSLRSVSSPGLFNYAQDYISPNKFLRARRTLNVTYIYECTFWFSTLGQVCLFHFLSFQLKWCAWIAVYCSFISFANSRSSEDTKQMMSSFMWVYSVCVCICMQNYVCPCEWVLPQHMLSCSSLVLSYSVSYCLTMKLYPIEGVDIKRPAVFNWRTQQLYTLMMSVVLRTFLKLVFDPSGNKKYNHFLLHSNCLNFNPTYLISILEYEIILPLQNRILSLFLIFIKMLYDLLSSLLLRIN